MDCNLGLRQRPLMGVRLRLVPLGMPAARSSTVVPRPRQRPSPSPRRDRRPRSRCMARCATYVTQSARGRAPAVSLHPTVRKLTSRIWSTLSEPARSCLFANTSSVAPASRWGQLNFDCQLKAWPSPRQERTSSDSSARSSSVPSPMRRASELSTTHTTASVLSK